MAGLRRKKGGKAGFENPYCGPSNDNTLNRALKAQVHVSSQRTPFCTYGQITTISTILLDKGFPTWLFSQTKTKKLKNDKAFSTMGPMYIIFELNLKQSS